MKVSIIIPTYNREHQLQRCLKSALNQTYTNTEIIVCDDGSTDGTYRVISEYENISYLFMENSGGPAKPRNHALKYATGDIIAFLDSDDEWYSDKLRYCVEAVKDGYDIVHHQMDFIKDDIRIQSSRMKIDTYSPEIIIKYGNPFMTSSVVLSANLVNKVGLFDESKKLVSFEDYDYWVRCLGVTRKVKFIDEPLGLYTHSKDSISQQSAYRRVSNLRTMYRMYSHYCNNKMPTWMNYELAKCYARLNRVKHARSRYIKSIKNNYKALKSLKNILNLRT